MKNIIEFNAREFKLDVTCEQNVGARMFVTDCFEKNIEVFEIGDWQWSWTQICCEKTLQKNTDYVFRFAVTGGYNHTNDALLQLWIKPDKSYEDRYTYMLQNSLYKPTLSKKYNEDLLRVYEIEFNTGDKEVFEFVFVSQHAVARVMPAYELSAYESFEDMTYQQKWQEISGNNSYNASSQNHDFAGNINLSGAVISDKTLNKIMEFVSSGCCINLSGAVISDDEESEEVDDSFKFSHFEKIAEHFDKKFSNVNTEADSEKKYSFDYNENGVLVSIKIDFDNDDYDVNVDWNGDDSQIEKSVDKAMGAVASWFGQLQSKYTNNDENIVFINEALVDAMEQLSEIRNN
ncbi:MAG: hypothetical protein IJX42_08340 [Oscillospiraceae bacterium]|nr:hypothetical protein [Oscillospiraceae bacterium]